MMCDVPPLSTEEADPQRPEILGAVRAGWELLG